MYSMLYESWKREIQNSELGSLSDDFYSRVAEYLRKLKEESRMLDKRTVKARLLRGEMRNVRSMLDELIKIRYRKLIRKATSGDKGTNDILTLEEKGFLANLLPLAEAYKAFASNLKQGHLVRIGSVRSRRNAVLRFLKDVPAIIGSDVRPYGPFRAEDVASVPIENARILTKQGLAEEIETR